MCATLPAGSVTLPPVIPESRTPHFPITKEPSSSESERPTRMWREPLASHSFTPVFHTVKKEFVSPSGLVVTIVEELGLASPVSTKDDSQCAAAGMCCGEFDLDDDESASKSMTRFASSSLDSSMLFIGIVCTRFSNIRFFLDF